MWSLLRNSEETRCFPLRRFANYLDTSRCVTVRGGPQEGPRQLELPERFSVSLQF